MKALTLVVALATLSVCRAVTPELRFAWKQVDFAWETPEARAQAIADKMFIPYNNVPVGLVRYKNKLFVSVPRWRLGVASTLNYIDLDGPKDQPLKPYPSFKDNYISDTATSLPSNSSLVSVFRMFVDDCERLWLADTGQAVIFGEKNHITGPSLVIFDLKTDQLILRHYFKPSDLKDNSFVSNTIVDVNKDTCDDAYAYVTDIGGNAILVYSLKQDESWRISHHFFHFDPIAGSFNVNGHRFRWTDGVFTLALTDPGEDGYRTAYFHALSSNKEFYVSTKILRNYRSIDPVAAFYEFKLLGDRGANGQSAASAYNSKTQSVFYSKLHQDSIACWNVNKPYTPENNPILFSDPVLYECPVDLKVDNEDTLWFVSDKLPRYMYKVIDVEQENFRIYSFNTTQAIQGTTCRN